MMHEHFDQLQARLSIDLGALRRSYDESVARIEEAKTAAMGALSESMGPNPDIGRSPLGIILHGSYARYEVTDESDFDYLIIAYELVHDADRIVDFRKAAERARRQVEATSPGSTNLFGEVIGASDLVDGIGLERDTNASTTRRVLFLEESVPLIGTEQYDRLQKTILSRYLHDYKGRESRPRVPRFLLNDIIRYWRTIAVDYQAKLWRDMESQSGVRYIKLRTTRKLVFFSSVVSALYPELTNEPLSTEMLSSQFRKTPLSRIAQLVDFVDKCPDLGEPLRTVFEEADSITAALGDADTRDDLNRSSHRESPDATESMRNLYGSTLKLHDAMMDILRLGSPFVENGRPMASLADEYLVL